VHGAQTMIELLSRFSGQINLQSAARCYPVL
jgi:hypothetical protein